MTSTIRSLIALCAASLLVASLIHFGFLVDGYRHPQAGVAEALIGGVMLAGLALTWMPTPWARRAALGALAFGLLGTSVGLFTILIGVGPRSAADVAYHVVLLGALLVALAMAMRTPTPP